MDKNKKRDKIIDEINDLEDDIIFAYERYFWVMQRLMNISNDYPELKDKVNDVLESIQERKNYLKDDK